MPPRRSNRKAPGNVATQKEIEKLQDDVWMWANTIETGFATLPAELLKLPISKSYDHLVATINEIIEAALCNPQHHALYAGLLLALRGRVKPKDQTITFHDVMVQQVQEYLDYVELECVTAYEQRGDEKGAVTLLDEDAWAKRQRFLKLILLVVSLLKLHIITYTFVLKSIRGLLPQTNNIRLVDQVKLECLCMLLTSFTSSNKKKLAHLESIEPHVKQLRKLCEKEVISARLRTLMGNAVAQFDQMMIVAQNTAAAGAVKKQVKKAAKQSQKLQKPQPAVQRPTVPVQSHSSDSLTVASVTIDFTRGKTANLAKLIEEPTSLKSSSSCGSFHGATDLNSLEGTSKSWALPILPNATKQSHTATHDKLVEMYDLRLRNHQLLQTLDEKTLTKNSGLTQPDFGHLQWMKKEASTELASKANSIHFSVTKFLEDAERSMQQHMRAYYETVEKAAQEKINELVESLPANSRADVNKRAYEASLSKSH